MPTTETSTATTEGIRVSVKSQYLADQSVPQTKRYVFAYTVTIANEGAEPAQLRTRHWIITDGSGKVEEVKGPGGQDGEDGTRAGELGAGAGAGANGARRDARAPV